MKTYFVPQGFRADIIATEYGSPATWPMRWPWKPAPRGAAWAEGRFARSVVPVTDQQRPDDPGHDEYMRPGTDMQALAR
jgi:acetyl-CoA C-acetyltransferase